MNIEELNYQPNLYERISYRMRRILGKIAHFPGALAVAHLMAKTATRIQNFYNVEESVQKYRGNKNVVGMVNKLGHESDSGFGYVDEFREIEVASYYRAQLSAGNIMNQKTESGFVYEEAIRRVSEALKKNPSIKVVTNFGVSYGHVDHELAKLFPNVKFFGVDRSKLTKLYNDNIFERDNLTFVAGDIFEHLEQASKLGPSLLLHIRTNTLLPEHFVRTFYAAAHSAGAACIVGLEQCGVSWDSGKPYVFTNDQKQPSVFFRNKMHIHNYPGILLSCGYNLTDAKLLKTRHPDANYRIICFTAATHCPE